MLFQFLHCGPECNRINSHLRSRMQYTHTHMYIIMFACLYVQNFFLILTSHLYLSIFAHTCRDGSSSSQFLFILEKKTFFSCPQVFFWVFDFGRYIQEAQKTGVVAASFLQDLQGEPASFGHWSLEWFNGSIFQTWHFWGLSSSLHSKIIDLGEEIGWKNLFCLAFIICWSWVQTIHAMWFTVCMLRAYGTTRYQRSSLVDATRQFGLPKMQVVEKHFNLRGRFESPPNPPTPNKKMKKIPGIQKKNEHPTVDNDKQIFHLFL